MTGPSPASLEMLSNNGVSPGVIDTALRLVSCIEKACDDVAETTGEDLYDDSTACGLLRHFRSRNRAIEEFKDDGEVVSNTEQNTLDLLTDDTKIRFYSSRKGIDAPNLAGGGDSKKSVVSEMQLQLNWTDLEIRAPRRLVLMYEADDQGLQAAALGVMRTGQDWAWRALIYDRGAIETAAIDSQDTPAYDQQQEPELPPIKKRDEPQRRTGQDKTE